MKVIISAGPARETIEVENGDAANVAELLRLLREQGTFEVLNIPAGTTPLVNGDEADDDTPVEDGDELAFNKPTGEKGDTAL